MMEQRANILASILIVAAILAEITTASSPWGLGNPVRLDPGHLDPPHSSSPSAFLQGNMDHKLQDLEACLPSTRPQPMQWSQDLIEDNGGTILAVAGKDYCILAADTRLSSEYRIRTRNVSRILQVSPQTFVGMAGSWADVITLRRELAYELGQFQSRHQRPIGTTALGRFLSNQLYLHRLQPIYAFNIVAGLDQSGCGSVYSYDVIGSFNRVNAACCGRGQELMEPVLDQFTTRLSPLVDDGKGRIRRDQNLTSSRAVVQLTCEEALGLVKESFLSGAEREISIGDGIEIVVMRKGREPYVERIELPRH